VVVVVLAVRVVEESRLLIGAVEPNIIFFTCGWCSRLLMDELPPPPPPMTSGSTS